MEKSNSINDGHLNLQQLAAACDPETLTGESRERIDQHVRECTACSELLRLYGIMKQPESNRSREMAPAGCADGVDWLRIATGSSDRADALKQLQHAASCDYCGPLLREALHVLKPEISQEEQQQLGSLRSSDPEWQTKWAHRLAHLPRHEQLDRAKVSVGHRRWIWVLATAAILIIAIPAWFLAKPKDVDTLLAQAYTEHRVMEIRFPGATYSPLASETRGTNDSHLRRPALL